MYEAKLLIVGEEKAGKTTLANKIQNPQYQLQENQPSTEGIDVIKWSFPLDNEREFKVNIWDFGGQEIYHATHQFFLTKRSLYTLVADTCKKDTDFYYWLNVVELLSDNSPLLIVKNEKQDCQREREIRIRVAGNNKRNFLTIVTHEIDKINDSYKLLKYQKFIPCNCSACKNSQNPYAYEFNEVLERINNRKLTIECRKSPYHQVQVFDLIDNAIDIKQLISQDKQDTHKSINFQGDNQQILFQLLEKGDTLGDFMTEKRNIKIGQGNYNENIEGNYYEQKGKNNTMTNITQSHSGSGDNVGRDKNITNTYNSQDLTQAAADIQALLEQLEQTYPTNTTTGKMAIATEAIQRIDNDPKLAPRILSALKAGGTSALDSLLDHPAASFAIAALEDWQQTKSS